MSDKLKRAAIINNSEARWAEYKIARNSVNANIRKAKTNYCKKVLRNESEGISRSHGEELIQFWEGICQQLK